MEGGDSASQNHHQPFQFSPILMGLIGIVAGAAMFATYQCIVRICKNRSGSVLNPIAFEREQEARRRELSRHNRTRSVVHVLQVIMPVFKYSEKECKDETCAVCLCEFSEGEDVRTLPQCMHSFHAPCVDMWLFSHSTCPLCRADTSLPASSRSQPREDHVVVAMLTSDEAPPLPEVQRLPEIGV